MVSAVSTKRLARPSAPVQMALQETSVSLNARKICKDESAVVMENAKHSRVMLAVQSAHVMPVFPVQPVKLAALVCLQVPHALAMVDALLLVRLQLGQLQ